MPGPRATLRLENPKFLFGKAIRVGVEDRSNSPQSIPVRRALFWKFSWHNRTARNFALALACFALARIVMAQEPTPSNHEPTIKVQVQQVLVPVIVTDRKGHFVTDLKASDFKVFEDGVEQKLAAFTTQENAGPELVPSDAGPEPRVAAPPPPGGGSIPPPPDLKGKSAVLPPPRSESPPHHTYLIVLDTLNSSFSDFGRLCEALKRLFKEEQGSDSQYALVALGRTTNVIQNMTRDPKVVLATLANKELTKTILSSEAANLANQQAEFMRTLEANCTRSSLPQSSGSKTTGSASTGFGECGSRMVSIIAKANAAAHDRENVTRNFLTDLRLLTEQLSRMPGRRVMILASDGFNLHPGNDLFEILAAYTGNPRYLLSNPTDDLLDMIKMIVRLATARNVTFYTLDSRGLYIVPAGGFDATQLVSAPAGRILPEVQRAKESSATEDQGPMTYLAQATGGVFYHGSNDLLKGLRQSFADGRQYYLLAYNPPNQTQDGKFHAISVQVKGKNLLIRAKTGYWASAINTATVRPAPAQPPATVVPAPAGNIPTTAPPTRTEPSSVAMPTLAGTVPTTPPPTHAEPLTLAASAPSVVDLPIAEIVREVPELKNLQPAPSQDLLASILQRVGANVATLFNNFPNVDSREQVIEERQAPAGPEKYQNSENFRYLALPSPDRRRVTLEEYRTDFKGRLVKPSGLHSGFLITEGFVSTPLDFHPLYQLDSTFRYLGQEVIEKRSTYVVAFVQKPSSQQRAAFAVYDAKPVATLTQGLAWIDAATNQIIRMWTGLLTPVPEINLKSQTTRIKFGEVHFQSMDSGLWLPREVEVETKFSDAYFRNFHFYSQFKLFTVQTQTRQEAPASP